MIIKHIIAIEGNACQHTVLVTDGSIVVQGTADTALGAAEIVVVALEDALRVARHELIKARLL